MVNKILALFLSSFILFSCKHESLIEVKATEIDCSTGEIPYENVVKDIFNANCNVSGCHNASSAASGVNLEDYTKTIETGGIVKGDAANSNLYKRITATGSTVMPPISSGLTLTMLEKDAIEKWINEGAKNTFCNNFNPAPPPCDSVMVSYMNDIVPLLDASCVSCHSGLGAGGNVELNTYANVKLAVDNGSLLGSIKHEPNYSNMPQAGAKWDDCKIAKVANWISEGALNN